MTQFNTPRLPTIPYTARTFATATKALQQYILATNAGKINSFFEGDVAKILIEMLAFVSDMTSYGIDRVGEESFVATMRNYDSALRHAASLGYSVSTSTSASVNLVPAKFADIPASLSSASSANASQEIRFTAAAVLTDATVPTAGFFTVAFLGETSTPIPYNATVQQISDTINAMAVIAGNVRVTGIDGGPWRVEFVGDLGYQTQPLLVSGPSYLTRNTVQRVLIPGGTTGNFQLNFSGQQTGNIDAATVDAAGLQAALEALSNIAVGDVFVTAISGGFSVEFAGAYLNTAAALMTRVVISGTTTNVTVTRPTVGAAPQIYYVPGTTGTLATYDSYFTKGQQVKSGNVTFEVAADTVIRGLGVTASNYRTTYVVPVVQGVGFTEQNTATGSQFQTVQTSAQGVVGESLVVYVGSFTTPWTQVEALGLAGPSDLAYSVRFNDLGQASIQFGDGLTGAVPPLGATIYIQGRTGGGESGNVGVGAIKTTLSAIGKRVGQPDIQVSVPLTNVVGASGGRDAETTEEMRRNIPAWVRTADKALTAEDFRTLAGTFESTNGKIDRAAAYLSSAAILFQIAGPEISQVTPLTVASGTVVQLGPVQFSLSKDLVLRETDPLVWVNPNTIYVYGWGIGANGFVGSSSILLQDVRTYLQQRSVVTTTVVTLPGRQRVINLDLGTVYYFGNYSESDVRDNISAAIKAYFLGESMRPGAAFRLSDFYQAVEAAPGVDHFVLLSPVADVALDADELPGFGSITYTLLPSVPPSSTDPNQAAFDGELFR